MISTIDYESRWLSSLISVTGELFLGQFIAIAHFLLYVA